MNAYTFLSPIMYRFTAGLANILGTSEKVRRRPRVATTFTHSFDVACARRCLYKFAKKINICACIFEILCFSGSHFFLNTLFDTFTVSAEYFLS